MKRFQYFHPSFGECWALVALFIAGSLMFGFIIGVMQKVTSCPVWTWQSLSYALSALFPLAYAWFRGGRAECLAPVSGERPIPYDAPKLGGIGVLPYVLLISLALIAMSTVIEPISAAIPMPDYVKAIFEKAFLDTRLPDAILSTCILAPLFEELLCRGFMMRGMLAHGMSPTKAIVWSAFIFAVIHLNPWQAIPAFAMGLLFGWIYYRTGSLWSTIFLHCLNNSLSTLMTRLIPDASIASGLADIVPQNTYYIIYASSLVICVLAISILNKKLPKNVQETLSA